jgi:hypothetical protein
MVWTLVRAPSCTSRAPFPGPNSGRHGPSTRSHEPPPVHHCRQSPVTPHTTGERAAHTVFRARRAPKDGTGRLSVRRHREVEAVTEVGSTRALQEEEPQDKNTRQSQRPFFIGSAPSSANPTRNRDTKDQPATHNRSTMPDGRAPPPPGGTVPRAAAPAPCARCVTAFLRGAVWPVACICRHHHLCD